MGQPSARAIDLAWGDYSWEVCIMTGSFNRRSFLKSAAAAGAAVGLGTAPGSFSFAAEDKKPLFKISLAEWSLHRTLFDKKMDNLDFPAFAKKEYGIDAVEYVNQ